MEAIVRSVEKYKRNALIELIQDISQDYELDSGSLYERYIKAEYRRCIARKRSGNVRCSLEAIPGTNFCKRHQVLAPPVNEARVELECEERTCAFKHDHPPYEKNVPGCKKCEHDLGIS